MRLVSKGCPSLFLDFTDPLRRGTLEATVTFFIQKMREVFSSIFLTATGQSLSHNKSCKNPKPTAKIELFSILTKLNIVALVTVAF